MCMGVELGPQNRLAVRQWLRAEHVFVVPEPWSIGSEHKRLTEAFADDDDDDDDDARADEGAGGVTMGWYKSLALR